MCYAWGEGGSAARAPFLKKKLFSFRALRTKEMEKKNTRTSTVAAVTSSPRVRFFIFHYESGLVLKIVFENRLFVAPFTQLLAVHPPPKPCSRRAGTPGSSLLPLTHSILHPLSSHV